jgi:transcriptional regulator with XRE-family HTH domain
LSEWRESIGLSQEDAAAILGTTQPTYCRWETGQAMPRRDDLVKIANKTGVSIDDLVRKVGVA